MSASKHSQHFMSVAYDKSKLLVSDNKLDYAGLNVQTE